MKIGVWIAKRIEVESDDPIFSTLAKLHSAGEDGTQEQYDRAAETMSKQLGIPSWGELVDPNAQVVPEHFFGIYTEDGEAIYEE